MIFQAHYPCPFGVLTIGHDHQSILQVCLNAADSSSHMPSPISDLAAAEIMEYFEGKRKSFTFPIHPMGTEFQKSVWAALVRIPYGQTRTYGQIAADIGRPKAARAVGMACNQNPVWIAIPCHRVLGRNGALTGYAGGLGLKQKLLELEHRNA